MRARLWRLTRLDSDGFRVGGTRKKAARDSESVSEQKERRESLARERVPLQQPVRLKFARFQDFLTEVSANISAGGMFLRSDTPRTPGEELDFVLSLEDGFTLVEGRGEVKWNRDDSDQPDRPAGMGVKFLELYGDSEALVQRVVSQHTEKGGETFSLEVNEDTDSENSPEEPELDFEAQIAALVDNKLISRLEKGEPEKQAAVAEPRTKPETEISDDTAQAVGEPSEHPAPDPVIEPPSETLEAESDRIEIDLPLDADEGLADVVEEAVAAVDGKRDLEPPKKERTAAEASPPKDSPRIGPREPSAPIPLESLAPIEAELPTAESLRIERRPREPAPAAAAATAPPSVSFAGVAKAKEAPAGRPTGRRLAELAVMAVVASGLLVLAFQLFWVDPSVDRIEAASDLVPESVATEPSAGSPSDSVTEETGDLSNVDGVDADVEDIAASPGAATDDVGEAVQAWAAAWSDRRFADYLTFYSDDFVPASGVSRSEWERRRESHIVPLPWIRVSTVATQVEHVGEDVKIVRFTQSYQSPTFRDRVRKTLRIVREDGRWKIASETVVRNLPW